MARYAAKRILQTLPILFGVSIIIFLFLRLIPGDPARLVAGPDATAADIELVRRDLGLDRPPLQQYIEYMTRALHGDFGRSMVTGRPVVDEIKDRFWPTLELAGVSIAIAILIGLVAGVLSAVRRNTWIDYLAMFVSVLGISVPAFWLGLMLMYVFAVGLRWLPPFGYGTWQHFLLPAITLGTGAAAYIARFARASMLEVLGQDYIRTARAKGVYEVKVNFNHALKNALIPVVTVTGLQFGFLLGGTVVIESVFAWPGIGRLLVDAVNARDYPVVQTLMLLFALQFVTVNLVVDLLYAVLDPRVSYE